MAKIWQHKWFGIEMGVYQTISTESKLYNSNHSSIKVWKLEIQHNNYYNDVYSHRDGG